MEIKSEIEVSIIEHLNGSNEDGAIDNTEVCKVEELKFESDCNSTDKNEGPIDPDEKATQYEENESIPEGEEGSEDEIKVEKIDTSDRGYRATAVTRQNSNAIASEESKYKIDLNDNRFYSLHLGRPTRPFKRINYNETTESDGKETIPGEIQLPRLVKENDFFVSEENDTENIGNSDPRTQEEDPTKKKIKV